MPINKVMYGSNTLIDITDTTAVASDVASGKVFYLADGSQAIGSASASGDTLKMAMTNTLISYDGSGITDIGSYALYDCSNLESMLFPDLKTCGSYAFSRLTLPSISLPSFTTAGAYAFQNCTSLTEVSMPKLVNSAFVAGVFDGCTALTGLVLPKLKYLFNYFVRNCSNLEYVDVLGNNNNQTLNTQTFLNCTKLNKIIFRYNGVVAMRYTNAVTGTPFASGGSGGTLYVPSAYVSSYQSATNWKTILGYENNQILPIEGSIYETQYADGTPIS